MPGPLIFDLETDGLLDELTKVHSLVIRDADTGELVGSYADQPGYRPIQEGLTVLLAADQMIGHNVLSFDVPALEKVYGLQIPRERVLDTLILSKVLWPEVKRGDFDRVKQGKMPSRCLAKPFSLEAWGYRLGQRKGEFGKTTDWAEWSAEMQSYCEQDTQVNWVLWKRIVAKDLDPRCVTLEHQAAFVCSQITETGFPFDVRAGAELFTNLLARKQEVTERLQRAFQPIEQKTIFIPKVNNKKLGYTKGMPIERVEVLPFNPGSREDIANRLITERGWKPTERTPDGKWKVDEAVLEDLKGTIPEAALLQDYLFHQKLCGQLGEGQNAWLKLEKRGLIHTRYDTAGAVTGRASHKTPNIAQVPSVSLGPDKHPLLGRAGDYGWECRSLFVVPKGWHCIAGADMSGLELRAFAHYLAPFDGGAYGKIVCEGDVHTANQEAAGLPTRANAKTFIYAFLYGAGDEKLGSIVAPDAPAEEQKKLGGAIKRRFLKRTPGLSELRKAIGDRVETRGYLVGLDGRPLTIRSPHAALNTLLQSCGAILCKRWMVSSVSTLHNAGLKWDRLDGDFALLAWVHDELQFAARTPEVAEKIASVALTEAREAGEFFGLKCPLAGEAKTGRTWAETH